MILALLIGNTAFWLKVASPKKNGEQLERTRSHETHGRG
jgi:hypothetical protein